ncbi:carboxymethylenebutenolidase homolog [Falco biarmicus]|uniref:carboxymethylenebutenolidase homolog n=1 Tax=Falco peregrinus TaxID=8954 RepID=UPI002479764E|nr:carboxymethylenebutenolidase homolog [Falco peregrinus]XP_056188110.1 carboxymethylenebutenolidase homolog [Falco biarmicus]
MGDITESFPESSPPFSEGEADAVLKYLKEQHGAKKLGVTGFCWGGIAVSHLIMTCLELKAGVSLYGLIKNSDDIATFLNPTFFIFAEKDDFIPLHQVTLLEQKLQKQIVKSIMRLKLTLDKLIVLYITEEKTAILKVSLILRKEERM